MSLSSFCPARTHGPFFISQDTLKGPSCFLLIVRRLFTDLDRHLFHQLFTGPPTLLFIVFNSELQAQAICLLLNARDTLNGPLLSFFL